MSITTGYWLNMVDTIFADVITIEKTAENFRLIYDIKGRFSVHRITGEEAKVCTVNCLIWFLLWSGSADDFMVSQGIS